MPCLVGKINIDSVSGGVINFGDVIKISPINVNKTISGSGGGGVGDNQVVTNGSSVTNGTDTGLTDQNVIDG
ncbi:spore germination protein [Metabacillus litoralis]|uniref:spore germination protein n=1 Tax=Metabacillus litoralis TaxID=152268 RepID=UPI001CFD3ECC|nr:spore germination protein [Metabacillus litoralis]